MVSYWLKFLLFPRKDDVSCLVHSSECSKQTKPLASSERQSTYLKHTKHKTLTPNVIRFCG